MREIEFSGVQRTGCIFCLFGITQDTLKGGTNRFSLLKATQPKLYDYCMRGGGSMNKACGHHTTA